MSEQLVLAKLSTLIEFNKLRWFNLQCSLQKILVEVILGLTQMKNICLSNEKQENEIEAFI